MTSHYFPYPKYEMDAIFMQYLNNLRHTDMTYEDYLVLFFNIQCHYDLYLQSPPGKPPLEPHAVGTDIWQIVPQNDKNPHSPTTATDISAGMVAKEPKKHIHIDADIRSLGDLLDITRKYPYDAEAEYNIDVKSLHNIKHELREINDMIGLTTFKETLLDQILYFAQDLHINREHDYKHTVIYGPPGTGKTQVAKLLGTMYSKMGILKNNVFRKVTRNDLVAGYLGQTAIKTKRMIEECLGGCLFIDEVYTLGCGTYTSGNGDSETHDSFSKECIDTLCEALSDHKDDLMVIIAGYEKDIKEQFFQLNKGLPSRFIWRFTIDEYNVEELMKIFQQKVDMNDWSIDMSREAMLSWFQANKGIFPYFGRDIEQLFTYTKIAHGKRIYGKSRELRKKITTEDLEQGLAYFKKHGERKKDENKLPESCFGLYL